MLRCNINIIVQISFTNSPCVDNGRNVEILNVMSIGTVTYIAILLMRGKSSSEYKQTLIRQIHQTPSTTDRSVVYRLG